MASDPRPSPIDGRALNAVGTADPRWRELPPICFYYPPGTPDDAARASVDTFAYRAGTWIWTVKTFGALSRLGFPCYLSRELPDDGIVVAHRELFDDGMIPGPRQLFACIVADFYRHPFAQLHVVQNRDDPLLRNPSPAWPAVFQHHWPEAALIPRDPLRGDEFANVSYFGLPQRLAPQLRSARFQQRLRARGFNLRIVDRQHWNDYSGTDAVLAVRSFANVSYHKFPPSKLYNSWIAGVPALLGNESAYRTERRNQYDYFEVRSPGHVLRTLEHLRGDPTLRARVARNCALRACEIGPERVAERWVRTLTTVAAPAYERWCALSSGQQESFLLVRRLRYLAFTAGDFAARAHGFVRKRLRGALP